MSQRTLRPGTSRRGRAARLRAVLVAAALAVASLTPAAARAAETDEDIDGRFIGYGNNKQVGMESRSTTLTYLAFFGLAVIGCVPLFKAAKRD